MSTDGNTRKILLVVGATGKQGSALLSALGFGSPSDQGQADQFHILALTRNAQSPAAKHLASLHENIEVVEGDLEVPGSIRAMYSKTRRRTKTGVVFGALADLALEFNVSCFVYSSNERGGEANDDELTLDRRAKVMIERHIKELGGKGLNWTVLHGKFREGTIGAITYGVLKAGLKPTTTVQFIVSCSGLYFEPSLNLRTKAVDDIGHVASAAPERYASKILSVIGDICTTSQIDAVHRSATGGRAMPSFPSFLAHLIIRINKHTQHLITELESVHTLRTDPSNEENRAELAAAREAYPGMMTFAAWAGARVNAGPREASTGKGWNKVSLGKLLTGKL
ncbi:hypothetical protein H0H92_011417 [Tricholoma furcatifolium]|nr:hypothetical protein H0H92_011417 [Tricholoma furcatifolium]